ncbi:hypothetical protein HMSSN139_42150 [Paenibacillus sp. HMSSN-139]|nr:hypothetical protein HMSSN139_42150 [Paenibacillus sp. HMSSN-139]
MMSSGCWKSKGLIDKGVNIAGIKQVMNPMSRESQEATVITKDTEEKRKEMTDSQIYRMLKQQLVQGSKPGQVSLIQGELSRFSKNNLNVGRG